jgi:hypothetical protein
MSTLVAHEILLEDSLSDDGMRLLHVMSTGPVGREWLDKIPAAARPLAQVNEFTDEVNMHHLELRWRAREAVKVVFRDGAGVIEERPVVAWALVKGDRVSEAVRQAAECYRSIFGRYPQYGWMKRLPVEDGMDVEITDGAAVILFRDDWLPDGFVTVGK